MFVSLISRRTLGKCSWSTVTGVIPMVNLINANPHDPLTPVAHATSELEAAQCLPVNLFLVRFVPLVAMTGSPTNTGAEARLARRETRYGDSRPLPPAPNQRR